MNTTDEFFIQCLSDHLNNRITELPEYPLDIDYLYSLSKSHDLTGIIYYQLKDTMSLSQQFLKLYAASIFYFTSREKCLEKVTESLKKHSIKYSMVKGPAIADLYPVPALRTMGDIDLLINEEDKAKIHQIMISLGYTCIKDANTRDWDYKNNNIEFEMHPLLIYPDEQVEKKEYIRFFNDFWKYVDENEELTPEFHLLYLFVHLRKHLLNHGAGMRQFMDIAVFTKAKQGQIDWKWIKDKLKELSLSRFAQTVYSYIDRWFEFQSPLDKIEIDDEFYFESTDRILQNGVFGFQAEDDNKALVSYAVAKDGFIGKMKYYLRMVFPKYDLMKTMKEYSFLNNKPWLLPCAWFIRTLRIISRGKIKDNLSTVNIETSTDKIHMIEKWGMR